jgi:hypothetical protein
MVTFQPRNAYCPLAIPFSACSGVSSNWTRLTAAGMGFLVWGVGFLYIEFHTAYQVRMNRMADSEGERMSKPSDKVQHGNYTGIRRWLLKNVLSSVPLWAVGTSVATSLGSCAPNSRSKNKELPANEILEWTATEAIDHVHSGSITAEHYRSELLKRYRESKALNVITWMDEDRVLQRARSVDGARSKGQTLGRLAGLPLVVKDNINTVGFPTTAGTTTSKGFYPHRDEPFADTLFRNGAILLGKTNMPELARGTTDCNPGLVAQRTHTT